MHLVLEKHYEIYQEKSHFVIILYIMYNIDNFESFFL